MRITVIGGGPGGLYFALLTKKQRPDWSIDIYEQNQANCCINSNGASIKCRCGRNS